MHLHFAWQAWRLETSTCIWGNRRATWRHLPAFGVAGVALVPLGGPLGRRWFLLVAWGAAPLCVAGVVLGDIYLRFTWLAWHLETSTCVWRSLGDIYPRLAWQAPRHFAWQAWHLETSTFVSRGRRGAWRHLLAFAVAGVALGDIYLPLALQAWHLETSTLAWQAWHLLHLVARLVAVGYLGRRATLRGRHSTQRSATDLCCGHNCWESRFGGRPDKR